MTYEPRSTEEAEFLRNYDASGYPSIALTSDIATFTIRNGQLSILLIERAGHPYKGQWALPGGFVGPDEDATAAAVRELQEETALRLDDVYLEQLKTYTTPDRDPRMRVVSVAFVAVLPDLPNPVGGDDAAQARWFAIEDLALTQAQQSENEGISLAFDHATIILDALERVRSKFEYTPLATRFLDNEFTLPDLRRVYETVWGVSLHPSNFRRKVLTTEGFVVPTQASGPSATGGRNAALYRAGDADLLHPAILRSAE